MRRVIVLGPQHVVILNPTVRDFQRFFGTKSPAATLRRLAAVRRAAKAYEKPRTKIH
ncbi:MAG: hypothetical protein AAB804_01210 [Patescibacteria group bacterium]